jgi:SAM-dependent methyltransferase
MNVDTNTATMSEAGTGTEIVDEKSGKMTKESKSGAGFTRSGDYRLPGSLECKVGTFLIQCAAMLPSTAREAFLRRHRFYQAFDDEVAEDQQGSSNNKWEVIKGICGFTGKRVLDIGCAEGFFARQAALAGATDVVGVESRLGTLMCARCIALRDKLPIRYRLGVFPRLGQIGKFDVILCLSVLHHTTSTKDIWKVLTDSKYSNDLKYLRGHLQYIRGITRSGGVSIIEMPYEYDDPSERSEVDFDLFSKELVRAGFSNARQTGSWDYRKDHESRKDRIIYVAEAS